MKRFFLGIAALAFLWSLNTATVQADYLIDVSVNTSGLSSASNLTPPFGIGFDMITGGDASSNTATISSFVFGGCSAVGTPFTLGNASGDLASTVTLEVDNSTNSFSYFDQGFTPGNTLSFHIDLTSNVGSTPDSFSFFLIQNYTPGGLLGGSSTTVPTTDPTGSDNLLFVQITPNPNNPDLPIIDQFAPLISSVPEPSGLVLSAISLASLGLAAGSRRLRQRVVTAG